MKLLHVALPADLEDYAQLAADDLTAHHGVEVGVDEVLRIALARMREQDRESGRMWAAPPLPGRH